LRTTTFIKNGAIIVDIIGYESVWFDHMVRVKFKVVFKNYESAKFI